MALPDPVSQEIKQETEETIKLKWNRYNIAVRIFAFLAPTIILVEWNFVLFYNGWRYTNASVSRVLAESTWFPLTLTVNTLGVIFLTIPLLARNIQIHVYFVNESFSLCWRYFNLISLISTFIGYVGVVLMTIFDVHRYPFIHIIMAGILIAGIGFYELFHMILTFRHRDFVYAENKKNCKAVWFFIDGILYLLLSVGGIAWTAAYVIAYQSTGTDITSNGPGITEDYYAYQWYGIFCLLSYPYIFILTLSFDASDDELQLFAKNSYKYMVKGFCNVHYCDHIKYARVNLTDV